MKEKKQTKVDASHIAILIGGTLLGAILMGLFQGISEREFMGRYIRAEVDLIHTAAIIENRKEYKTEKDWLDDLERLRNYISENYKRSPKGQIP